MSALIKTPSRSEIARALAHVRGEREFGLGGCAAPRLTPGSGSPGLGGSSRTDPRCWDLNYLMCCKVPVATAALAVAPGTVSTIQIEPQNAPFFKACAWSIVVVESADETLRREARLFGTYIQGCPQMGIRNQNPNAASTDFIYTSSFDPINRDGCACPVSWGTFSNNANSYQLTAVFFNANATAINISVTVFGDEKTCSPGCDPGADRGGLPDPYNGRPVPQ